MSKVIIFAGTTEGYELCRFLDRHQVPVLALVATDYGRKSLKESEYLQVRSGRLTAQEMQELISTEKPSLVMDATHPYAVEVTENIRKACEALGCACYRVLRKAASFCHIEDIRKKYSENRCQPRPQALSGCEEAASPESSEVLPVQETVYVDTTESAVEYLKQTTGGIFLTVGSKELKKYTEIPDYRNRLYARVLSLPSVVSDCAALGLEGSHLIGMQGPFSRELNTAMLRQTGCRYLVTKDTGNAGGFEEKMDAARECQVTAVVIGRPCREEGLSLAEARRLLIQILSIRVLPQITVLGAGMGTRDTLTAEGLQAVKRADLVIGARRLADAVRLPHHTVYYEYRAEEIRHYLDAHPEYEHVLIALSGDVGFYSGAQKLLPVLADLPVQVLCGISSLSYFMAKISMNWEDACISSVHGKKAPLISLIRKHRKVFAILGGGGDVSELAQKLTDYGMGEVLLYIGENLSYDSERITCKKAKELTHYQAAALSVLCAYWETPYPAYTTQGIPDREFIRGNVPMTKEEVRAVSLAKLRLTDSSVCYDIGAGTGSVSVEMALRAVNGQVFAIEKKEEACTLIEKNRKAFAADHLQIISGTAPQALEELPAPTHVFIGGSSGKLREILVLLLKKNPSVRIVINCITLETVSEALEMMKEQLFSYSEVVQISVSRSREAGSYHLMTGENPIYIFTFQNSDE